MSEKIHSENRAIVIMAGGTGTRLWPLSRKSSPKQFQALVSEKTLLRETFDRVKHLIPTENIFVCTAVSFADITLAELPELSRENLIIEPSARGTCSAIALSAQMLTMRNKGVVIATIASDHAIENPEEFSHSLLAAFEISEKNQEKIVTIGINPTNPDTGLGYIKIGEEFGLFEGKKSYFIDTFREKPDQKTAEEYLASFEYLWNAGYFIFSGKYLLEQIEKFVPETSDILQNFSFPLSESDSEKYNACPNDPIDTAIIEKLPKESRIVVPSSLKWSDIGSFDTLFNFLKQENHTDSIFQGNVLTLQSKNNFVHTSKEKLVTLVGVDNLVVVETDDALLILHKDEAKKMKDLIATLKQEGKEKYL